MGSVLFGMPTDEEHAWFLLNAHQAKARAVLVVCLPRKSICKLSSSQPSLHRQQARGVVVSAPPEGPLVSGDQRAAEVGGSGVVEGEEALRLGKG